MSRLLKILSLITGSLLIVALLVFIPQRHPATAMFEVELPITGAQEQSSDEAPAVETAEPEPEPEWFNDSFTIVAGGDVLVHNDVRNAGRHDGTFDFNPMFEALDPWIKGADLAICNMEVPVAPPGVPFSSFPKFAIPAELIRDLGNRGWTGCAAATNHSVDQGFAGIVATLEAFDAAGMGVHGIARTAEEANQPQLYQLHRGGRTITIAHLSATWSTNYEPVPSDKPWAVEYPVDADRIIEQARQARENGADLVILSMHVGIEYTTELHRLQQSVPPKLAESGLIDLIIGNHSHVPQGIEHLDGGPNGNGMWVTYSHGNLVTGQPEPDRSTGLLTFAEVEVTPETVRISNLEWAPVVFERGKNYRVHAVVDGLEGTVESSFSTSQLEQRRKLAAKAVGDRVIERLSPPTPTGERAIAIPRPR